MYLLTSTFLTYLNYVRCANILGVFTFPSISHQTVFQPIWRELSLRGHKVTVVTPDPLNDPALVNLTEISVRFAYELLETNKLQDLASKDVTMFSRMVGLYQLVDLVAETELNSTGFRRFLQDEEQRFDLILIEGFHPVMYGLSGRFSAPIIGVFSLGLFVPTHDLVGNLNHPVVSPDSHLSFHQGDLTVWQIIQSTVFNLWLKYYHNHVVVPKADDMARRYFGNGIGHSDRNVDFLFPNVNPLIYCPRPITPAVIEMGQMHIKPVQPLPQDLQLVLDQATEGAIFFSLGSNVKTVSLGENLRNVIIQALAELPYTVLLKWESDHFPGKPPNVITWKWFPQQDILAHPNVRAFVTQGGLQSFEEAVIGGVPLVGMPFFVDQPMNVQKVVELGIGVAVDPATVTKDELKRSIIEVAENNNYRRRIKQVGQLLKDRPMTGIEKVVWWSEYVIRNRGARWLRSPAADISLFHYLLLDVVLMVVVVGSASSYGGYKIVRILITRYNNP